MLNLKMLVAAVTSVFWGQEDKNLPTLLENRRAQESHMTPNQRKIKYYRRYSKAKVKALFSSTLMCTKLALTIPSYECVKFLTAQLYTLLPIHRNIKINMNENSIIIEWLWICSVFWKVSHYLWHTLQLVIPLKFLLLSSFFVFLGCFIFIFI